MAWPRYQKTDRGRQELHQRTLGLDLPTRALLMLGNGRASLAELRTTDSAGFEQALRALQAPHDNIAVYQGRKAAAALMQHIRGDA